MSKSSNLWEIVEIDSICRIVRGSSPRPKGDPRYYGGPVPRLMVEDLTRDGKLAYPKIDSLTLEGAAQSRPVPAGTVVMVVSGQVGRVARVAVDACIHDGFVGFLDLDTSRVDPDYLIYCLENSKAEHQKNVAGAIWQNLTTTQIRKMQIPLPPLAEQKRIAAILDGADALRAKRRVALARLDALVQSVFLEMFGDPVTNPMGWEVTPMSSLLTFLTSGSRGWAKYYSEQGTLFLRIQNIGYNELRLDDLTFVQAPDSAEKNRTRVQAGDILLSITADLGRTAVVPMDFPEANINQHLALLRVASIEPEYLSAFLATSGGQLQFERLNRQGVKAGLNFDDINTLTVLVPPSDLQKEFIARSRAVKLSQHSYKRALDTQEKLFHSLQQRAFRGEL